jgi:hypothetical protein
MHKSATKCNETIDKWCKNKHGASKIIDTLETYQPARLMEMAVRSMETAETATETDGDGSGGTSPSRQGAGTETSVPRNLASTAAALRNCFGNFADSRGFI